MYTRFNRGYSPILVTTALSVAILIATGGMQLGKMFVEPAPIDTSQLQPVSPRAYIAIEDADENGMPDWRDELARGGFVATTTATTSDEGVLSATSTDPVSGIGTALLRVLASSYLSLKEYDAYTPERGEELAETIATNFRAPETFVPHTIDELSLDTVTSQNRVVQYRADMRVALEPLISEEEYELTLYGAYVQTKDTVWLEHLLQAAARYRSAETNLIALSIPGDAAPEHLRLVNALGMFAQSLERMARFANDPLASLALLRTYNEAEREIDLAFDALVKYYARTIGN